MPWRRRADCEDMARSVTREPRVAVYGNGAHNLNIMTAADPAPTAAQADWIVMLEDGRVARCGQPYEMGRKEITTQPEDRHAVAR